MHHVAGDGYLACGNVLTFNFTPCTPAEAGLAVEDVETLESELMALQNNVQK